MVRSLNFLAAATLLGLASTSAFAQVTVAPPRPSTPATLPDNQLVTAGEQTGGLVVYAYDSVRQTSLVEYLGIDMNQIANTADLSTSLDFGVLSGWSTAFGASNLANVRWHVTAADNVGYGGPPDFAGAEFAGTYLATTAGSDLSSPPTELHNQVITNAGSALGFFGDSAVNGACAGTNPCTSTNGGAAYAGRLADHLNTSQGASVATLPFANTGRVGDVLDFYLFAGQGDFGLGTMARYAGTWLLSETGALTYDVTPVPLPAAAWLLLSGLAGMGVVSRRRQA